MSRARLVLPRASRRLLALRVAVGIAARVPRQGGEEERWRAHRCDGVVTSFSCRCVRVVDVYDLSAGLEGLLCGFLVPLPSVRYAPCTPFRVCCLVDTSCTACCTDSKVPGSPSLERPSAAGRARARRTCRRTDSIVSSAISQTCAKRDLRPRSAPAPTSAADRLVVPVSTSVRATRASIIRTRPGDGK